MIIILLTQRICAASQLTYSMVAKTSWHRHGTKLRHCNLFYTEHLHVFPSNMHVTSGYTCSA